MIAGNNEIDLKNLTPKEVVTRLDEFIVGQGKAKKAVAIALRNRWRRQHVDKNLQDDIIPKNILMIGPTGVGKTEIARRLAKLADAPFVKVEASKFTEVGYVGRDVETMIRDLAEMAHSLIVAELRKKNEKSARRNAENTVLNALKDGTQSAPVADEEDLLQMLRDGLLDDRFIEIEVVERASKIDPSARSSSFDIFHEDLGEMFKSFMPEKKVKRKLKIKDALPMLINEELNKIVNTKDLSEETVKLTEQMGIVFIDEIDKVASKGNHEGPDVSRQGVQRDLLPIVEGSTIHTKYGHIRTNHILFIAAGAFHVSSPSDLIPELQGRFPIRVNLDKLSENDFVRILSEPRNNLILQYVELLKTEGLRVDVKREAVEEMAKAAFIANEKMENIGARRLHTVMELVFEDLSFDASEMEERHFVVDAPYVRNRLKDVIEDIDLSKYIL